MKTQHEKNKEILMEEIEKYCNRPMNDAVAAHLSTYRGALKAMCMLEHGWNEMDSAYAEKARGKEPFAPTPELDGDTEFEQIVMKIPVDTEHISEVFKIFNTHMNQMESVNPRAYNRIIERLKGLASA